MKVTFWGTRGSIAKPGPSTLRYGGNTSCVEVRTDAGTLIVVDCGTGAHGLGFDLLERSRGEPVNGNLLIGHTHWDHIQGLPFFAPLFQPGSSWNIYGPRGLGSSIIDSLAGQMQYAYFPISIEQLVAQVEYHDLVDGTFEIEDATVTSHYLNHPALTLGYRIEADGASVVYASDHEPHDPKLGAGGDLSSNPRDADHVEFLSGADLVIHDAQYLASEYAGKTGWGHSTVEYVVDAGHQAGVGELCLYHHDPSRTDEAVDGLLDLARDRADGHGFAGTIIGAAEGQTVEVVGGQATAGLKRRGPAGRTPAFDDLERSILIAVGQPDIAATIREAAEAEGLTIWETGDGDGADAVKLAREHRPSIIVLEDDDSVQVLAHLIRSIDPAYGSDVNIVRVTSGGESEAGPKSSILDSLPWPFSAVYARTRMHASLLRRACRWQVAPRPDDEATRLQSLRDLEILDTPPEDRFDDLTKQALSTFDMPIALVSLVDDERQWFKSVQGLDVTETGREVSFCSHAILGDGVFQVPDALADERFADNPLVAGDPRVRFYAGIPLTLSNGSAVGTLCVIDYRPRLLDDAQIGILRQLGQKVVDEMETHSPAEG